MMYEIASWCWKIEGGCAWVKAMLGAKVFAGWEEHSSSRVSFNPPVESWSLHLARWSLFLAIQRLNLQTHPPSSHRRRKEKRARIINPFACQCCSLARVSNIHTYIHTTTYYNIIYEIILILQTPPFVWRRQINNLPDLLFSKRGVGRWVLSDG